MGFLRDMVSVFCCGQSYNRAGHKSKHRKKDISVCGGFGENFYVLTEKSVEKILFLMIFGRLFFPMRELLPILERQASLLTSCTEMLNQMLET